MHGGCKCPKGYTGEYCQFVEGSVPSDWEVLNYPSVAAARAGVRDGMGMSGGRVAGIVMGSLMGICLAFGMLFMFIATGKLAMRLPSFGDKEMDSNDDNENDDFIGGKSVYIKRRSTKTAGNLLAVADMIEADGSVLKEAIAERDEEVNESAGESPTKGGAVGLQEVDLDDLASSLDQDHKTEDEQEVKDLPSIA